MTDPVNPAEGERDEGAAAITTATVDDVDALMPLVLQYMSFYHRSPHRSAVREYLRARLASRECVIFLATRDVGDREPIGYALLYPSFSSLALRRSWILNDLFVAEPSRRSGIARDLLHAVHRHAVNTGADSVRLETEATNRGARLLYESEGYLRDDRFLRYARLVVPG